MRTKPQHILLLVLTALLSSCNLFIDELDDYELPEYEGNGYDEVVTEKTSDYEVSYQFKKSTLYLPAGHELMSHLVNVDVDGQGDSHNLYFDAATPREMLPKTGQVLVSSDMSHFPFGLCDLVCYVAEENGLFKVCTIHTEPEDAFENLDFKTKFDVSDYLDEYDIYTEDGEFVAHIDKETSARMRTRSGEEKKKRDFELNFDEGILHELIQKATKKLLSTNHVQLDIDGGVGFNITGEMDYHIAEEPHFHFKIEVQDGTFDLGIKISLGAGTGYTDNEKVTGKLCGNDDMLNGKIRLALGPVVVVPVLGVSLNYSIDAAITAKYTIHKDFAFTWQFDGTDFKYEDHSQPLTHDLKFEASASVQFPLIKMSIGFGLYTSALTVRQEFYFNTETKASMEIADFNSMEGISLLKSPKLEMAEKIGFGLALVAKGSIIAAIIDKISEFLKDRALVTEISEAVTKAIDDYARSGTVQDWVHYLGMLEGNNEDKEYMKKMDPAKWAEMQKLRDIFPAAESLDDKKKIAQVIIDEKTKEFKKLPKKTDDPKSAKWKKAAELRDLEKDDSNERSFRLGPIYPEITTFTIINSYLFPKVKDKSFKIGERWSDGDKESITYTAEYVLEDPGIVSLWTDRYPYFVIMEGDNFVKKIALNHGQKLEWVRKGYKPKTFTADIEGLDPGKQYVCVPAFYRENRHDSIVDKPLPFAAEKPSAAITGITVNRIDKRRDESINKAYYDFYFDTHTSVVGLAKISTFWLQDNNTNNKYEILDLLKTFYVPDYENGTYTHHWSVRNSEKNEIKVSFTPFIGLKSGSTKQFSLYERKMKHGKKNAYKIGRWPIAAESADDEEEEATPYDEPSTDYQLTLDSVSYDGVRIL